MFAYNLWTSCLRPDTSCQWLCPFVNIAMSNNFETLSCVHYTIFSVVKFDLCIQALFLDCILTLKKNMHMPRVHLVIPVLCPQNAAGPSIFYYIY